MKYVGYIKGLAEGYALQSEDSAFEQKHLSDVAYFAEKLAVERKLNPNLALVIAYGHDLGRIKNGVYGKGHSVESEKIVSALLETSDFETENLKIIGDAIRNHNQKSKIQDAYSELIKDADAMAHNEEGILDPEDGYEYYRMVASEIDTGELNVSPIENWLECYTLCLSSLSKNVKDKAKFLEVPDSWVHEQRILVRQARSILWYLKMNVSQVDNAFTRSLIARFTQVDDALKDYFLTLRKARQYFVYSEKAFESQTYQKKYYKELKALERHFDDEKTHRLIRLIANETNTAHDDYAHIPLNPSILVEAFHEERRLLTKASVKDIKKLHTVRISGKKFKYLSELGLITFQHIAIKDAIDRLHDHIGKLNDYSEITNLENWKKHFNASEISSDLKKHQRKCREVIFFFHLIANSEIIGNQTTGTQI